MTPRDLIAAFETLADAPDGVTRLRELVLQLAVRGKLVPQDPTDEPASVLLGRIAKDKARLISAKEIRKPRSLPTIEDDGAAFEVPPGWVLLPFGEVFVDVMTGPFGTSLKKSEYLAGGTPVVNPQNLKDGRIVPTAATAIGPATLERLSNFKLQKHDIVVARRGEMGRCAIVGAEEAGWLCGTGSLVLRPPTDSISAFAALFLRSPGTVARLGGESVGATMMNLNQRIMVSQPFHLPPLAEQHRIVARVDELMGLLDRLEAARAARDATRRALRDAALSALQNADDAESVELAWARIAENMDTLFTHPDDVAPLRQTILQLAVRGRLVPQDPEDEPASVLLERSAAERETLTRGGQLLRREHPGVRIRRGWEPPSSWESVCVYDVAFSLDHKRQPVKRADREARGGNIPYYGANGQVGFIDEALFDEPLVLVVEDETFIGRVKPFSYLVEGQSWVNNHVHALKPSCAIVPTYLNIVLSYYPFIDATSGTTNRRKLLQPVLLGAEIALPPLAEQHRIVARVEELMGLCDDLEARLAAAREVHGQFAAAAVHDFDA